MVQPDRCPACGAERPANAPQGACPCCLMRLGLDDPGLGLSLSRGGPGAMTGPVGDTTGAGAGVLAALTARLGPIPRVLLRDTEAAPEPILRPLTTAGPAPLGGYGRLQLLGEMARGGMGVVLKGRDADLGRELAVKVLLERHRDDPELVRRFVEEAQIAGQLQHPGIVPVYELGAFADRQPFFTMKLVKGRTLAEILRDRPGPGHDLPRLLTTFLQVAQTMAYAHARGVIHRDLKPSNVMVGGFGEVQVMDWGLAKVLPRGGAVDDATAGRQDGSETIIATARSGGDASDLSRAGSVLGTPAYMAPEQARGEVDRLDERCDVFALGSILCEVLTGEPAFVGRTSGEIQRKAARGEVAGALARLDAGGADPELRALTAACLAPEVGDRPRDAGAVAERLSAHLAGVQERLRAAELARAAEEARTQEALKSAEAAEARAWAERRARRLTAALAALVVCLIGAGAGGYAWAQRQATARAARAAGAVDAALAEAERAADAARAAPGDTEAGWPVAVALARKADDLARQGDADEPTRRRAAAAVERLRRERSEAAERARLAELDRRLLGRLVEARLETIQDLTGEIADSCYGDAFREAGFDPYAHPAEAGAALRARPPAVAEAAAAALDAWALARRYWRSDDAGVARLTEAARVADPDPGRCGLRAALELPDQATRLARLRGLADAAGPDSLGPVGLESLGRALEDAGDRPAAERLLVSAQRRYPGDAWINFTLGRLLWTREKPDEAIPYLFAARAIHPETAIVLAPCFSQAGKDDEAEAVYRGLVRLKPLNVSYLFGLGSWLRGRGQSREAAALLEEAVVQAREALRRRPDRSDIRAHLIWALMMQGKAAEAEAASRELIRRLPSALLGHYGLVWALDVQRRYAEAEAEAREVARLKPDYWIAYEFLGAALRHQGRLEDALTAYRRAQDLLGQPGTSVAADLATLIRGVERHLALAPRLAGILSGDDRPKDAAEGLDLAALCLDRDRPAAAARLLAEVLTNDPGRADSRPDPSGGRAWGVDLRNYGPPRYVAARAAAQAGAGQGRDAPPPDDPARAQLRGRALAYMRQEQAAWARELDRDDPARSKRVRAALVGWLGDPDLYAVRLPEAVAALPEAERAEWGSFWDEVDALLRRAAKSQR